MLDGRWVCRALDRGGGSVLCGSVSQTISAEEELRKIQLSEVGTEKP